jgi:hypothetical protein
VGEMPGIERLTRKTDRADVGRVQPHGAALGNLPGSSAQRDVRLR